MALFADEALVERRRLLQARKPKPNEIKDLNVAPGSPLPVQAGSVAPQSVGPGNIKAGSITAVNIKAGSITANHIKARSITAEKIVVGTLTAVEIKARAITADRITAGTLTANEIMANTITAGQIAANTITADRLVARTITAGYIAADTITANEIAANAITTAELSAGSVTAGKIAAGAVQAGNIAAGGVLAGNLAAGSVTAGTIAAGVITADMIASGSINAAIITIVASGQLRAIDGASKVRATMDAAGFTVYGPDGTTVWMSPSNGLLTPGIAAGAVGPVQIVAGGVQSTNIAAGAVVAGKIAAGAVVAGTIAAGAVVAASIAADQIVASHIQSQEIAGINIYASGFSNAKIDASKKYALDANGLHIRTSGGAATAGTFQYVDFFDGTFTTRGKIQYDFYSGNDYMTVYAVGALSLVAASIYCATNVRINGDLRVMSPGEYRMEGAQGGLYGAVRMRAAAAGHWYGNAIQFRARRVDGSNAPAAPSSITIQSTLQNANVTSVDYASITTYGVMFSISSAAAGDAFYAAHFTTN